MGVAYSDSMHVLLTRTNQYVFIDHNEENLI